MARKSTKRKKSAPVAAQNAPSRRDVLGRLALYGVGAAVLVGGGGALAMDVRRKLAEGDLDRIGNGQPSVVQIHDPQCALCTSLQKATRRAFRNCDETQTQFLVANVRSDAGAQFQADMGLPHVTLVFFDGDGRHVHTMQGVTPTETIKAEITRQFG